MIWCGEGLAASGLQDLQAKGRVLRKALENSRKTTGTVCYVIKIWETL